MSNKPFTTDEIAVLAANPYARLVFSGELEQYVRDMAGMHGMID